MAHSPEDVSPDLRVDSPEEKVDWPGPRVDSAGLRVAGFARTNKIQANQVCFVGLT